MSDTKAPIDEFARLKSGEQKHLLRLKENNFLIGANITVREFDEHRGRDTGNLLEFKITSMETGEKHPAVLSPRFVILSLGELPPAAVLT